jgi:hypothetical protein
MKKNINHKDLFSHRNGLCSCFKIQERQNFRGIFNSIVVDVLEGEGKTEDPKRIVHYVYIDDEFIGKIDNSK